MLGIIIVCGIPGAGKSHFLNKLKLLDNNYVFYSFDMYYNQYKESFIINENDKRTNYEYGNDCYIEYVLSQITNSYINKPLNNDVLIFIEDNFPIKSSRKPFYKFIYNLNKRKLEQQANYIKNNYSYTEIHFNTLLNLCLEMNSKRKNPIPDDIISSMNEKYEKDIIHNSLQSLELKNDKANNKISLIFLEKEFNANIFISSLKDTLIHNDNIIKNIAKKEIIKENSILVNKNKNSFSTLLEKLELSLKKEIHIILSSLTNDEKKDKSKILNEYKKELYKGVKNYITLIFQNSKENSIRGDRLNILTEFKHNSTINKQIVEIGSTKMDNCNHIFKYEDIDLIISELIIFFKQIIAKT